MRGCKAFEEDDQFAGKTTFAESLRNRKRTYQADGLIGFHADNGNQGASIPNTEKLW